MSITTEIQRLQTAKADIKTAIEGKGVTVPSGALLSAYDDYIGEISGQSAYILVTSTAGATLTCGSQTYTLGESETEHAFSVGLGTYTVTASKCGNTKSEIVGVVNYTVYKIYIALPRLPFSYQEVTFVRSTGAQWIETGIHGSNEVGFDALIQVVSYGSENGLFAVSNARLNVPHYVLQTNFGGFSLYLSNSDGSTSQVFSFFRNDFISHHIQYNIDGQYKGYLDDELLGTSSVQDTPYSQYTFALFGRKSGTEVPSARLGEFLVEYFKIYEDSIMVRNFVPCYRKSDYEIGMYDLVTNTFFTNQGTGSFIAGSDVN